MVVRVNGQGRHGVVFRCPRVIVFHFKKRVEEAIGGRLHRERREVAAAHGVDEVCDGEALELRVVVPPNRKANVGLIPCNHAGEVTVVRTLHNAGHSNGEGVRVCFAWSGESHGLGTLGIRGRHGRVNLVHEASDQKLVEDWVHAITDEVDGLKLVLYWKVH